MIVSELIEMLQELDPDANVLIMAQQNWPFENGVSHVMTREDMLRSNEDDEDVVYENGTSATDVFIVEGRQLRYGSKAAWNR
jgi:hypothetical protein